jgi:hypothetical protein
MAMLLSASMEFLLGQLTRDLVPDLTGQLLQFDECSSRRKFLLILARRLLDHLSYPLI